jgi:hypothetical protein
MLWILLVLLLLLLSFTQSVFADKLKPGVGVKV